MGLIELALRRPITVLMLFLVPITLGILALPRLPVDRFPRVNFPNVFIQTSYPGATPQDVEVAITELIEDAVSGVAGVEHVTSNSNQGSSTVIVQFTEDTDLAAALVAIERRIGSVRRRLPQGAGEPGIRAAGSDDFPIMNISLSSDRLSLRDLYTIANDEIAPQIQSVPGVADVAVSGGATSQLQVRVDPAKLRSHNVSLIQVRNALQNWNLSAPAGPTQTDTWVFNTRTLATAQRIADLEQIVVASPGAGAASSQLAGPVLLKDVASVVETDVQNSFQRLDGHDAVGLRITQQSGANSIEVSRRIRERLDQLLEGYGASAGLTATITSEQARFTRAAVEDTTRALYLAVIFAGLVLVLFLHNFRNTLIVLIAIPASLIPTFFVMNLVGIGLNTISLMGLALVVGILVDDSIVVIENINRHLKMGKSPWDAAREGVSEIGLAVAAITMATVAVFIPLVFVSGNVGRFFRELGLVMAVATGFSLLVSLLLSPMLASRMLNAHNVDDEHGRGPMAWFSRVWERGFGALREGYRSLLAGALRVRWLPVLAGFSMLGIALTLVGANPLVPTRLVSTEFVPREDNNLFSVNIQMPQGSTIQLTEQAARRVEARLAALPEVQSIATSVRQGEASFDVELVSKGERSRSVFEIIGDVRGMAADIPGAQLRTQVPAVIGGGGGSGLNLIVRGPDVAELERIANEVMRLVRAVPGTAEVRTTAFVPVPEYRAVVDLQRAADLGVTPQTIGTTLNTALGSTQVSVFRPEGRNQVDIVVRLDGAERMTPAELGAIPVQTSRGATVRLDQVASIVPGTGPTQISRYDRQRQVQVQASVTDRPFGDVLDEVQAQLDKLDLPVGYSVRVSGQGSQLNAAFAALLGAMALSIIFMFMVLAALYESMIYPWAVVLCLPVALVGALFGLIITGNTVNIFSMMGMILLVGLVAKNAILLVDYTNTLRKRGLDRRSAILEAGPTRLRPIMMTSLTIIFALFPLALKLGEGAESRAPLAVVVIGGILTSTLLTLVMVPCAYTYLDDLQTLLTRLGQRLRRPQPAQPELAPAPALAAPLAPAAARPGPNGDAAYRQPAPRTNGSPARSDRNGAQPAVAPAAVAVNDGGQAGGRLASAQANGAAARPAANGSATGRQAEADVEASGPTQSEPAGRQE